MFTFQVLRTISRVDNKTDRRQIQDSEKNPFEIKILGKIDAWETPLKVGKTLQNNFQEKPSKSEM